ncbi:MAG: TetR/AcrR family transcriptional regulator [Actinobacteria bacterium]|nr:TetR/AcrR family transcriptional regulator [Actinomycetota bacterium]
MSPRTIDRDARRAQLVDAAARSFAAKGVNDTSVADIVRAAGVAQGTFYLYFESKDDVVVAVVSAVGDRLLERLSTSLADRDTPAPERIRRLASAFADLGSDRSLEDVAAFIHRPENQRLHDRFAEHVLPRLVPLLEDLIADGVAAGAFDVSDRRAAAWFVLGGFRSIELAGVPHSQLADALDGATRSALRVLGSREER